MDSSTYDSIYESESKHWWFVGRRHYVDGLLSRELASGVSRTLCEVGCGSGGNFEIFSKYGTLDAVEMDEGALERAKTRNKAGIRYLENGWLPDNMPLHENYDVIAALDVIEHIDDDVESLRVLKRSLNPGGKLILTVPAYQWLWTQHDDLNHHKRRYTCSLLKEHVRSAGFKIKYCSYFNTFLFPLSLLVRLMQKLNFSGKKVFDEFKMPSPFINQSLTQIFGAERLLAGKLAMPFGLSIALVAEIDEDKV